MKRITLFQLPTPGAEVRKHNPTSASLGLKMAAITIRMPLASTCDLSPLAVDPDSALHFVVEFGVDPAYSGHTGLRLDD